MSDDDRKEDSLIAANRQGTPPGEIPDTAQTGSRQAPDELEALFQTYHSQVFRSAMRITGSASDAEDVLQTVFLRLLRREEQPDLSSGGAGYFHRAAVNAALDLLRSRKRSRAVDLTEAMEQPAEEGSSPESAGDRRELAEWLRRSLGKLSNRASEIFSLRYFEGYGNREIAELLGISQTAVAVTLHRTRHRLRKELAPLAGGLT